MTWLTAVSNLFDKDGSFASFHEKLTNTIENDHVCRKWSRIERESSTKRGSEERRGEGLGNQFFSTSARGEHFSTGWYFLTGSALKVLSVGNGKIPTKKSESKGMPQRKCEVLTQTFTFLVGVLQSPALRTLRAEPVKKTPCILCYMFFVVITLCWLL